MRTNWIRLAIAVALAAPFVASAQEQTNPCADHPCNVVFEWGNSSQTPDVDRKFGAPSELENAFMTGLQNRGWRIVPSQAQASMTIRVRLTEEKKALCDTMPGVNPDYTCHTVSRAAVVFTANDSTAKPLARMDMNPRCSDPKAFASFPQFGAYAAEYVNYSVAAQGKGDRPKIKCM